jgi:hypothetical protein
MTAIAELNVGDVLRLTGEGWQDRIGRRVRVDTIVDDRAYVHPDPEDERENGYFHAAFVDDRIYAAERIDASADTSPANVEPRTVTLSLEEYERLQREATREFSRYDARLRPMFVNAARVATAADFCHEYDRIAGAVGAPSREELFVKQFNHCVTVTVEFHIDATGDSDPDWSNAELLEMVNNHYGTNIGDGDIAYLSWDITESEDAGLYDPETGETYEL